MADFNAIEAGNDPLTIWFFWVPVIAYTILFWTVRVLNDLAHWVVNTCDPVQVPTDQTDIPISEDTTSHTGMPAGPVPATGAEPSHTRARTRTREDDDREVYERVQVRDSRGRFTSRRVLVRIDL